MAMASLGPITGTRLSVVHPVGAKAPLPRSAAHSSRAGQSSFVRALGPGTALAALTLLQRRRSALRAAVDVAPTDYYGLLGLPPYTADKKEIKAAHRRTVKLVHPDILGAASGDLQVIVNAAYRTLSDDETRERYDITLRRSKLAGIAMSQWNKKGPEGLFVDETVCSSCLKCAVQCPGTIEVDPLTRKPHVYMQYGSDQSDLDIAVYGCPEQAISKVPRKLVPLLEYCMAKSRSLKGRLSPFQLLSEAHCRVVALTNPQELGAMPADALLREEYTDMMTALKEDFREARDKLLDKYLTCDEDEKKKAAEIIAKNGRPSSQVNDEDDELGVFVDETVCTRCYKCVEVASSTFAIHRSPERGEKAHAVMQDADAAEILEAAVRGCPSQAIAFVKKEDVPLLDLAMKESAMLAQTSGVLRGPIDIFQEYLVDDVVRMDLELRDFSPAKTVRDARSMAEMADVADEISTSASAIPEEVRARLWKGIGGDESAVKELEAMAQSEGGGSMLSRNTLKADLFKQLDADSNGFLYSEELRGLAADLGFEGSESDWSQEYVMICSEVGCNPTQGLDFRGFSQFVDDEEAGYLEDEEIADLLGRSL